MRAMSIYDWAVGFDPDGGLYPKSPRRPRAERDDIRRAAQKAENARLQEFAVPPVAQLMTLDDMLGNAVWIADGSQVGFIDNPQQLLAFRDFTGLTAASTTQLEGVNGKVRDIANALLWKKSFLRKTVGTRTFYAGAGAVCRDPDGRVALNSWRPIPRAGSGLGAKPFLDHVSYLISDDIEREAFLDWLAHIEQQPGILPHYGYLHVGKATGTGRNFLASLFARVWRGYIAPNVDLPELLASAYNGQLAGRVLAIVDEVQEGGGEGRYRHANRLKSLVNAEFRDINPKYGRQYREHNSCRWLVFSNHDNALPINDTDRRWRVLRHDREPRSPTYYTALYARLRDAEFVNAVGVFLRDRDISRFNPGERPPMNEAKRVVVDASKSAVVQYAEQMVALWPADVVTNRDISRVLSGDEQTDDDPTPAMRLALRELNAVPAPNPFTARGRRGRGWIIRNHWRWETAPSGEVASEANRVGDRAALQILMDRQESARDLL